MHCLIKQGTDLLSLSSKGKRSKKKKKPRGRNERKGPLGVSSEEDKTKGTEIHRHTHTEARHGNNWEEKTFYFSNSPQPKLGFGECLTDRKTAWKLSYRCNTSHPCRRALLSPSHLEGEAAAQGDGADSMQKLTDAKLGPGLHKRQGWMIIMLPPDLKKPVRFILSCWDHIRTGKAARRGDGS